MYQHLEYRVDPVEPADQEPVEEPNRWPGRRPLAQGLAVARKARGPVAPGKRTLTMVLDALVGTAGVPLPGGLRRRLEAALDTDLADVRVHAGSASAAAAGALGAAAFTTGRDIHFAADRYQPESPAGQRLLAHEVAHAAQHRGAAAAPGTMAVSEPGDPGEVEADRFADRFMGGAPPAAVAAGPGPRVWRALPDASLGSEQTTAPIARDTVKPDNEMVEQAERDAVARQQALVALPWVEQRTAFGREQLFAQSALMQAMQPPITKPVELEPVLDILAVHGIITRSGNLCWVDRHPIHDTVDSSDLKRAAAADAALIRTLQDKRRRRENGHDVPVVETEALDPGMVRRISAQVETEAGAQQAVTAAEARLDRYVVYPAPPAPPIVGATSAQPSPFDGGGPDDLEIPVAGRSHPVRVRGPIEAIERVADGGRPATETEKQQAEAAVAAARARLARARRNWSVAPSVARLLERLRKINAAWQVNTYGAHGTWNEYAVDLWPASFAVDDMKKFFDDLDAACQLDERPQGGAGKFAWRAIYNDREVMAYVNDRYGNGAADPDADHNRQIRRTDHHDHVHLDLRPFDLQEDQPLDFDWSDGHVVPH